MSEPSHSIYEISDVDADWSGIVPIPVERDESLQWDQGLFEQPAMTSYSTPELLERRRKLRKLVSVIMAGATALLVVAGVRAKARVPPKEDSALRTAPRAPSALPQLR